MPTLEKSHANRDKLYILASTPRSVSRRAGPEGAAAEGVGEWGALGTTWAKDSEKQGG